MIRVYQCKDDCCIVREPSKRFWYGSYFGTVVATETSRLAALESAVDYVRTFIPQEVTA